MNRVLITGAGDPAGHKELGKLDEAAMLEVRTP